LKATRILLGTAGVAVALFAWWAFSASGLISPFILPPPASVLDAAQRLSAGYLGASLLAHLQASLAVVLTGYLASVLVGVSLGVAMAWLRPLDIVFGPLISLLRPIPPPAWIPLAILWFGIGLPGKAFVVFVSTITPCLINAYVAIKQVPPGLISAARTLGASRTDLLFRVAIPAGMPVIANGMRMALGTAWATVVAAELVVATAGFGFVIMSGYRNFEANIMAAGIVAVALTGFSIDLLFQRAERHFFAWSERDE
jgi:NitT/TauT family transport system permease protein/taurine transport system permease protein